MKYSTFRTYTRNKVAHVLNNTDKGPLRLGTIVMKGWQAVFLPTCIKQWTHVELADIARAARQHADFHNAQRRAQQKSEAA